jgi:hypothetical protein
VFGVLSWPRVVAITVLIALMPVGFEISALALSGISGLIVVGVAVWDTLAYQGRLRSRHSPTT